MVISMSMRGLVAGDAHLVKQLKDLRRHGAFHAEAAQQLGLWFFRGHIKPCASGHFLSQ